MSWHDFTEAQKGAVLHVLEREAERLEREADQLQAAAEKLGRPSLVDRHEIRANAFRAAISLLKEQS